MHVQAAAQTVFFTPRGEAKRLPTSLAAGPSEHDQGTVVLQHE